MIPEIAYVTLTVAASVIVTYTNVYCPACGRRVMALPGTQHVEVRAAHQPSGRGLVMDCQRCGAVHEVIQHGS